MNLYLKKKEEELINSLGFFEWFQWMRKSFNFVRAFHLWSYYTSQNKKKNKNENKNK